MTRTELAQWLFRGVNKERPGPSVGMGVNKDGPSPLVDLYGGEHRQTWPNGSNKGKGVVCVGGGGGGGGRETIRPQANASVAKQ